MIVVGFGGGIEAGKTTLINACTQLDPEAFHIESWHPIGEVADLFHNEMPVPPEQNDIRWMNKWLKVLPAIVQEVVHVDCDYDQLQFTEQDVERNFGDFEKFYRHSVNLAANPELANHKITDDNKSQYRPILQWLGSYLVSRVKPTIWYDEIFSRLDSAEQLGAELGLIGGVRYKSDYESVHAHGGTVIKVIRPDRPEKDSNDPTERERNSWIPDITVYNNDTEERFVALAPVLLDDIRAKKYKSVYLANDQ